MFVFAACSYCSTRPATATMETGEQENPTVHVPFKVISDATDGFSKSTLLGTGSFAAVHRGRIKYSWLDGIGGRAGSLAAKEDLTSGFVVCIFFFLGKFGFVNWRMLL